MAQAEYVVHLKINPLSELEALEMAPLLERAINDGLLTEEEAENVIQETLIRNLEVVPDAVL